MIFCCFVHFHPKSSRQKGNVILFCLINLQTEDTMMQDCLFKINRKLFFKCQVTLLKMAQVITNTDELSANYIYQDTCKCSNYNPLMVLIQWLNAYMDHSAVFNASSQLGQYNRYI